MYNGNTNTWVKLEFESRPSARTGACLICTAQSIFIFGGRTRNGFSNELWSIQYETLTLELLSASDYVYPLANHECQVIEHSSVDLELIIVGGAQENLLQNEYVFKYNVTAKEWTIISLLDIDSIPKFIPSNTCSALIDKKIVLIAGELFNYITLNTIILIDLEDIYNSRVLKDLEFHVYNHACAYIGNSIYLFSGGYSLGNRIIKSYSASDFIRITDEEWECSPGTFSPNCDLCSAGTYSEGFNKNCSDCLQGNYGLSAGARSSQQCYPCEYGTFNKKEGMTYCRDCETSQYCPIGTITPLSQALQALQAPQESSKSIQPNLFENINEYTGTIERLAILSVSLIALSILVLVLVWKKLNKKLKVIDLYTDKYNYLVDQPMMLKQTRLGGLLTLIFVFIAIYLLFNGMIQYIYRNTDIQTSLIPFISIEQEYKSIKGQINIEITMHNYGGQCATSNSECINESLKFQNLENFDPPTCKKPLSNCIMQISSNDVEISADSSIEMTMKELSSYASYFTVNITSVTGIPDEISSIEIEIHPENKEKVFRGTVPTILEVLLTPTIFKSEKSNERGTGYHIEIFNYGILGTTVRPLDIYSLPHLGLTISLLRNPNAYVILHKQQLDFILFFSAIFGSVVGVLEFIGFLVKQSEKYKSILKQSILNARASEELKHRPGIIARNFSIERKPLILGNIESPIYEEKARLTNRERRVY